MDEAAWYYIVERNFNCHFGEIDLIARKDGYLIFVEVKYRSNLAYGEPVRQWISANRNGFPMRQHFI